MKMKKRYWKHFWMTIFHVHMMFCEVGFKDELWQETDQMQTSSFQRKYALLSYRRDSAFHKPSRQLHHAFSIQLPHKPVLKL